MKMFFGKFCNKSITDFKKNEINKDLWKKIKGGNEDLIIEDLADG